MHNANWLLAPTLYSLLTLITPVASVTTIAADTSVAFVGPVVQGDQTDGLPLNGRSWVRLMTLAPGAIDGASGTENNQYESI